MSPTFGTLLRGHRLAHRFTQQQLALEAEVSTRHLSCIETGRATPSREMVLLLARTLEVPLRERNRLLEAAGFSAQYRETPLGAPPMAEVRHAVELILRRQEPFAAVAVDRHWNVILANEAWVQFHRLMQADVPVEPYVVCEGPKVNLLRLFFGPIGYRQALANWDAVARAMVPRLQRDAAAGDDELRALTHEVLSSPDVPRATPEVPTPLVIPVELRLGDATARLFTTITTLGTAQDITLEELRIEAFHPADRETERLVRALAGVDAA